MLGLVVVLADGFALLVGAVFGASNIFWVRADCCCCNLRSIVDVFSVCGSLLFL